jgi:hypothetical protein
MPGKHWFDLSGERIYNRSDGGWAVANEACYALARSSHNTIMPKGYYGAKERQEGRNYEKQ